MVTTKYPRKSAVKATLEDKVFYLIIYVILGAIFIMVFYPLYFILVASVTDPKYVNLGQVLLYPKGFTFVGYQRVFEDSRIFIGYFNTIIYTVFGTVLGLVSSIMAGYALSRKDLPGRNVIMLILVFTMYFSGGLIPFYLVVRGLHLVNSRLLMVILGSVSVYNIILIRSFFSSTIPAELQDAAFIDGCSNQRFFFMIVLPLSKAIISVIGLYLAVGYWNSFFNAMIFMTDRNKYPLQLFLREMLLQTAQLQGEEFESLQTMAEVIKYGAIVVSTAPIMCVYPFIQKHFVKGVMIGSIKG